MTDLEDALRAMLHDRAGDIQTLPGALGPAGDHRDDEILPQAVASETRRRWWLVAAAAVVVVAAAAGIGAAHVGRHRDAAGPATGSIRTSAVNRTSCTAALPASWSAAAARGVLANTGGATPWGVTAGGDIVLTVLKAEPDQHDRVAVLTLQPTAGAVLHPVATFDTPTDLAGYAVSVAGEAIVVALSHHVADAGAYLPDEIDIVNATSGAKHTVFRSGGSPSPLLSNAYVADGKVYWDVAASGSRLSTVHEYDIASGASQVVGTGQPNTGLQQSAAGVWWSGDDQAVNRPELLPPAVADNATGLTARVSLASDGTSYAWATGTGIAWSSGSGPVVDTTVGMQTILAVAGPLVVFDGTSLRAPGQVLDTRTGAVAPLAAGAYVTDHGELISDYPLTASSTTLARLTRIDATRLPELHC